MKKNLREKFLKKRKQISLEERLIKGNSIYRKLIETDEYKEADMVFTYVNMCTEVDTKALIEKAWKDGKKVAIPVTKQDGIMYFIEIKNFDGLKRTKFGTMEPISEEEDQIVPRNNSMFIVPGSVFDESRNRCGYGGGYYDRYIEKNSVKNTIGVCYDFQIIKEIPVDETDKKLDKIITENRTIL